MTALPVTARAWTRFKRSVVGLRRDAGRAMILKGCSKVMNSDPSPMDREATQAIIRALVAMNDAEIERTGAET